MKGVKAKSSRKYSRNKDIGKQVDIFFEEKERFLCKMRRWVGIQQKKVIACRSAIIKILTVTYDTHNSS